MLVMPRRFTATEKWNDGWFLELSNDHKLVWQYILDTCTAGGRWVKNFKLLNFCCNTDLDVTKFSRIFIGRVIEYPDYFFIPKFLKYQYPRGLNSNKPAVIAVKNELERYNLLGMIEESLGNDYVIIKDTVKDKNKDTKEISSNTNRCIDINTVFNDIWLAYPNRVGRKEAFRHFKISVKNVEDVNNIKAALEKYIHSDKVKKGYIQNGSTWFNNWRDWIDEPNTVSTEEHDKKILDKVYGRKK